MKKIFYYTVWDFTNYQSDGICKKILSQIKTFEKYGYQVDYSFYRNGDTYIRKNGEIIKIADYNPIWNKLFANKKLATYIKRNQYDAVYCRYACSDWFFIKFLKNCRKHSKGVKIAVEMPSYPYDQEINKDFLGRLFLAIDKLHRGGMKRFIDKVVTYSDDKYIFGVSTIRTKNGADFSEISLRKPDVQDNVVDIIAVATVSKWHGYDRLLEGLGQYYYNGGTRSILFHLVGGGHAEEMEALNAIVDKWKIQDHVIFYGPKYGQELDTIYDKCDLAAACFGFHRIGATLSSNLKSREYMAKGMPIIASVDIDVWQGREVPYFLKVPYDDSPINMQTVLNFYDELYQKWTGEEMARQIRQSAEKTCDIKATMKPVIDYFELEK